jgi:SAM-dependent methyltransferase
MFKTTYQPHHDENRMRHEGDTLRARKLFFDGASKNLKELLKRRYQWMNRFIEPDDVGVEVGCGTGISKQFIRAKTFELSDVADYDWLDHKYVDALATPFADSSYDFIVASNMIHHVARPIVFFREMDRILKPGGRLIIQEVNASLAMRISLRLMRHEGYSYEPDVFDPKSICNVPGDPWSANCAIPNLLFDDQNKFEQHLPSWQIIHSSYREFLSMLNSGGVIAKTFCVPMPVWMLQVVRGIDTILATLLPSMFAMQRQIVLEKKRCFSPSGTIELRTDSSFEPMPVLRRAA